MEPALGEVALGIDQEVKRLVTEARTKLPASPLEVPQGGELLRGHGYERYRRTFEQVDSVVRVFAAIERTVGAERVSAETRHGVEAYELAQLEARVRFLTDWLSGLIAALPEEEALSSAAAAEGAFDAWVMSRLPLLLTRERELLQLREQLEPLLRRGGAASARAKSVAESVHALEERFATFSRRLLAARQVRRSA